MQTDPIHDWRRLAEHYRTMADEQLEQLALDFTDLTEPAQQALRSELQSRGLADPETIARVAANPALAAAPRATPAFAPPSPAVDAVDTEAGCEDEDTAGRRDYTWKTVLCECEEWKQAWQLGAALHRAGIESWPESAQEFGRRYSRVWVAADQLEQARAIANQPIPQDIVAESEAPREEYVLPSCPGCGAADPVLESADPVNEWKCELCGRTWKDAPEPEDEPEATPRKSF
jgi:hypothetical protein